MNEIVSVVTKKSDMDLSSNSVGAGTGKKLVQARLSFKSMGYKSVESSKTIENVSKGESRKRKLEEIHGTDSDVERDKKKQMKLEAICIKPSSIIDITEDSIDEITEINSASTADQISLCPTVVNIEESVLVVDEKPSNVNSTCSESDDKVINDSTVKTKSIKKKAKKISVKSPNDNKIIIKLPVPKKRRLKSAGKGKQIEIHILNRADSVVEDGSDIHNQSDKEVSIDGDENRNENDEDCTFISNLDNKIIKDKSVENLLMKSDVTRGLEETNSIELDEKKSKPTDSNLQQTEIIVQGIKNTCEIIDQIKSQNTSLKNVTVESSTEESNNEKPLAIIVPQNICKGLQEGEIPKVNGSLPKTSADNVESKETIVQTDENDDYVIDNVGSVNNYSLKSKIEKNTEMNNKNSIVLTSVDHELNLKKPNFNAKTTNVNNMNNKLGSTNTTNILGSNKTIHLRNETGNDYDNFSSSVSPTKLDMINPDKVYENIPSSLHVEAQTVIASLKQQDRKLTPAQIRKQHQKQLAREERERKLSLARDERERKLNEEKELRQKERIERELQKKKERDEKEEQRKKEREEKDEQRRKEKEERDRKKQEEINARNDERRKREEEKRLKEENENKLKRKAAEAFTKFFVQPKSNEDTNQKTHQLSVPIIDEIAGGNPNELPCISTISSDTLLNFQTSTYPKFMPFRVKKCMRMAPIVRLKLTDERRQNMESKCFSVSNMESNSKTDSSLLYLNEIQLKKHEPLKFGKTWNKEDDVIADDDDDLICLDDELEAASAIIEDSISKKQWYRAKFLKFYENRRPPYYGTWRKTSGCIKARKPFRKDEIFFDYEIDSDDEWEEEEPGESLHGSDDEKDKESEDDYDIDNKFFVPHGHLSDEEIQNEDEIDEDNTPEMQKEKLKIIQKEFADEMSKKTQKIKPRLIGLVWEECNGEKPVECVQIIWDKLQKYSMIYQTGETTDVNDIGNSFLTNTDNILGFSHGSIVLNVDIVDSTTVEPQAPTSNAISVTNKVLTHKSGAPLTKRIPVVRQKSSMVKKYMLQFIFGFYCIGIVTSMVIPEDMEVLNGYTVDTSTLLNTNTDNDVYFEAKSLVGENPIRDKRSYHVLESIGLRSHFQPNTVSKSYLIRNKLHKSDITDLVDKGAENLENFHVRKMSKRDVEKENDTLDKLPSINEILPEPEKQTSNFHYSSDDSNQESNKWISSQFEMKNKDNVHTPDSRSIHSGINNGIKARTPRFNFITQQNKHQVESKDAIDNLDQNLSATNTRNFPDKYGGSGYIQSNRYMNNKNRRLYYDDYPMANDMYLRRYDTRFDRGRRLNYYYPNDFGYDSYQSAPIFAEYYDNAPYVNPHDLPAEPRDYNSRPYIYSNDVYDRSYSIHSGEVLPSHMQPPINKNRRIIYYATLPDIVRTPPQFDYNYRFRSRYDYPYYDYGNTVNNPSSFMGAYRAADDRRNTDNYYLPYNQQQMAKLRPSDRDDKINKSVNEKPVKITNAVSVKEQNSRLADPSYDNNQSNNNYKKMYY